MEFITVLIVVSTIAFFVFFSVFSGDVPPVLLAPRRNDIRPSYRRALSKESINWSQEGF